MSDTKKEHVDLSPLECGQIAEIAAWWEVQCNRIGREVPGDRLRIALDCAYVTFVASIHAETLEEAHLRQNAASSLAEH